MVRHFATKREATAPTTLAFRQRLAGHKAEARSLQRLFGASASPLNCGASATNRGTLFPWLSLLLLPRLIVLLLLLPRRVMQAEVWPPDCGRCSSLGFSQPVLLQVVLLLLRLLREGVTVAKPRLYLVAGCAEQQ